MGDATTPEYAAYWLEKIKDVTDVTYEDKYDPDILTRAISLAHAYSAAALLGSGPDSVPDDDVED